MYKIVENSRGIAPKFEITVGLQEGYGPTGKLHAPEEVQDLVLGFLKARAAQGLPFLTGTVTAGGTLVYAWPEGPGQSGGGSEPQAMYSGNVNPLYNSAMTQGDIEEFLNDLAGALGVALGQTRVYVAYDGELWILECEHATTPTGD